MHPILEDAFSASHNDGVDQEPVFVDEIGFHQGLDEGGAAGDEDVPAGLLFSLAISSATFLLMIVELFHSAFSSVEETTTFRP
jgi:hypothetical protein